MRFFRLFLMSLICLMILHSCNRYYMNKTEATKKGFVREFDEPTTRGQLARITPPDMDISWRFALSPDRKSIVFSGKQVNTNEPYQLYKLEIGSSSPVKITAGGDSDVWNPSFTADGECIVYSAKESFWKVRKDGSGAKMKVPGSGLGNDFYPQLSKDDRVVFVTHDALADKYMIWACGLNGAELTQYREGNYPVWSPDGTKIAFEYSDDIWMMNADGTELTQLTATQDVVEGLPFFSPDGKYVAYVSNEGPKGKPLNDFNIWYMSTEGTFKTQVTELDSWDSWPSWTEDGIYFLSGRAKGNHRVLRIWRINVDL